MHKTSEPGPIGRPSGRRGRRRASTKSSMRRGYNKGGKVNTNNRFSGRTQTNPKGRPKK